MRSRKHGRDARATRKPRRFDGALGVRLNLEPPVLKTPISLHTPPSRASIEAVGNFERNLAAIALTQPRIAEAAGAATIDVEWLFGRDGSLTARNLLGKWWSGCSLPLRAAKTVLKPMDAGGRVAAFLAPAHAAQVRVALQTLISNQALLALGVDESSLRVMLHCEDFTGEIGSHRLWFAWGRNWDAELDGLLEEQPGLAVPAQFIRAGGADTSSADDLIPVAQKVFHAVSERRSNSIRQRREAWRENAAVRKMCVIAPSHFRLWDDSGTTLANVFRDLTDLEIFAFDGDDPLSASSLALAASASDCDAIIAPGIARGDLPDVAPVNMPWVTWVVTPRIPPFAAAGPRDALLMADPAWKETALEAGWPEHRVAIGAWPAIAKSTAQPPAVERHLALIADTRPIEIPQAVEDYSSHRLLWEFAQNELLNDPLRLNAGIDAYLNEGMRCFQIADPGFERRIFLERLIVPAYQQGLARMMINAGLPLRLWGAGWERIDEFRSHACGTVGSREHLSQIVGQASAVVHPLPCGSAHPLDVVGRPVIKSIESRKKFIALCRKALDGGKIDRNEKFDVITGKKIAELIRRVGSANHLSAL